MAMHAGLVEPGTRLPMSWEEYNQLGDEARGEFIDGALLTAPTPDRRHQAAILYLVGCLREVCGRDEDVTTGWGWSPAGVSEEYVPDVMVHPVTSDEARFTGVPLLCAEITSTNWVNDLVLKRAKYAAAGLRDYWIVDRRENLLRQYQLHGDVLVETARSGDQGRSELRFAGRSVDIDLRILFGAS